MNKAISISAFVFLYLASDQCDWPDSVDCDFDPSTVRKLKQRTYLYLTFDDGPNEGTPNVLRALQVKIFALIYLL